MSLHRAEPEQPRRRRVGPGLALLVIAIVAAYGNAVRVPFVFDDVSAVEAAARSVRSGDATALLRPPADRGETTSGRPVVMLTFALNYAWGGENVAGYHVVNTAIHVGAALLLFGIVRRTLSRPDIAPSSGNHTTTRASVPLALTVAAVWALHPLQTQSVTYLAQRAESLAGLWLLLTLYAFIRGTEQEQSPKDHPVGGSTAASGRGEDSRARHGTRWLVGSVVACALGMATKETMVVAPLLVLLYDRTFLAGSTADSWRSRKAYYAALAATWLVLAALVIGTEGRGGTAGFDTAVSPWHYLLTQCGAVARYLRLAFWPHPLVFDYGVEVIRNPAAVLVPATCLVALAGATVWALRRGSAAGFAGCWFFLTLAPSSSVVPIASQTMAEHRMYLALAAPIAIAVVAGYRRLGARSLLACVVVALACGWLTNLRNETYRSELALWSDVVAKRPTNARAHHNLGLAEMKRARFEAAIAHFENAVRLRPDFADSHYNIGLCLARLGRVADAIPYYEGALAHRPDHAEAHNNLGNALLALDRVRDARRHYERALQFRPAMAEAHSNVADALLRLGEPAEALRHAEQAIRLNSTLVEAHHNAGNASAELGRLANARAHYEAALRLAPDHASARANVGNVLVQLGHLSEAVPHYERALRLDPGNVQARRNLALVLLNLERPAEAVRHLEELLRTSPGDAEIRRALAEARAAARR